jgi:tetrahydromethanopterin S-methyltransferase subunit G
MSEDRTKDLPTSHSFEEKVLARLDAIDSRLASLEKRAHDRDFETKPIWERVLSEFSQMRVDVETHLTNFDRKLDIVNKEMLQLKANHVGLEERLDKVEAQIVPNIIVQGRDF